MKTKETYELTPHVDGNHMIKLIQILNEIVEVALTRSDGVDISITRTVKFPTHKGKDLIESVEINFYDIAA